MPALSVKKELLSPAGDYESFLAALNAGADAIYLAGTSFGARAYAKNFTNEELEKAMKMAHLYGVKIYVTMNTMIKEKEVEPFLEQVKFLYERGVDAILMQDIGMIALCKEMFEDLEIHASTQVNCSTKDAVRLLEKLGVKRVVFPREMSLEEIDSIKTTMEKEIFIHGALCISYSGNCLFSFFNGGRSANRGECAGCCRLPYTLLENGKKIKEGYLLSMKELHTAPSFDAILKSNVVSLKIEGRMKSSSYVSKVTKYYRNLLDGKETTSNDLDELKTLFYREFTKGHLLQDKDYINTKYSNHLGLSIGTVEKVTPNMIWIRLKKDLYQEDGIRFQKSGKGMIVNYLYNDQKKLTSTVKKGHLACLKNTINLKEKEEVFKTSSKMLEKSFKEYQREKIPVTLFFEAHIGSPMKLKIDDHQRTIEVDGKIIEKAKTRSVEQEEIEKLLRRLQDTPFKIEKITFDIDDQIFISLGDINALRRKAVAELIKERTKVLKKRVNPIRIYPRSNQQFPLQMTAFVRSEKALNKALQNKFARIYVADYRLYQKYQSYPNIYNARLRNTYKNKTNKDVFSQELCENAFLGYGLNVANSYSAYYLSQLGAKSVTLSIELTDQEQEALLKNVRKRFGSLPLEMIVKGKCDAMVIKGNPLKLKENRKYQLKDYKNQMYPIFYQEGITTILSNKSIYKIDKIQRWYDLGISSFCQIYDE